jgi:D-3-phosphoglycerate dehydrogenase
VTTGELAIALLVALARHVPAADAALKAGRWDKKKFTGTEISGKVLGVVGLGRIGRVVAERGKGLAMEVVAYDPFVTQERAPADVRMLDFDELLGCADFVSIHVPLADETRHLFGREPFAKMKKGARLIHAARGGIVDEAALVDALESGHLAGAALDVFETEPLPEDHKLRRLPNVVLTPHIGASTHEASRNVAVDLAKQIALCLEKGIVLNGVNVPRIAPSEAAAIGPYLDLAHDLAHLLSKIHGGERLQSLRVTLQGGLTGNSAHPLTVAALVGALHGRAAGPVTPVNAERIAADQGVRVHTEHSTMKRDFLNLIRVEAVFDERRHCVSGTVLGHRHGRLVELDDYVLDAIPESPLLVTFHRDQPGVLGKIGTVLGELGVNIGRMQLGPPPTAGRSALGIWNLDRALAPAQLERIRGLGVIDQVHQV